MNSSKGVWIEEVMTTTQLPQHQGRGPEGLGPVRTQTQGAPRTRAPEATGGPSWLLQGRSAHEAGTRALPPFVRVWTRHLLCGHRGNEQQTPLPEFPSQPASAQGW